MENTEPGLKDTFKEYINARIDIIKLEAIKGSSPVITMIILGFASIFMGILILTFLGFSAAYAISNATDMPFLGFLIVGVFYLLLVVLAFVMREKLITLPIVNAMMKKIYYKETPAAGPEK